MSNICMHNFIGVRDRNYGPVFTVGFCEMGGGSRHAWVFYCGHMTGGRENDDYSFECQVCKKS